jgi:flavin reductase (DIM6/NTAB) family NADH-FMN oxidoreductase RutF
MAKDLIKHTDYFEQTCRVMSSGGALLVSLDKHGKPNPMTIGWGTIGIIWGRPIFVALVRHSRYTHECLEHTGDFTVNIPPPSLSDAQTTCGTVSGRDHDKMAEENLTPLPSLVVKSPGIEECAIIYECRVVQKTDVIPGNFDPEVVKQFYPQGDFHTVYFGEIVRAVADREVARKL